jgi:Tol biopolymer transport system component
VWDVLRRTGVLTSMSAVVVLALAHPVATMPQPAPGSERPAPSRDGSRLAFVSEGDLFIIGADGHGQRRLTQTADVAGAPAWTGSETIAFSTSANDTSRVYVVDPNGLNRRLVASVPGRDPVLSPDNNLRVLYGTGPWTATKLIVSNLDGSEARQVTDGSSIAWNGRWSPNSQRIAYTGRSAEGGLAVFVMHADGSDPRQLTHLPPGEGSAQVPAWSPDGLQIALQASDTKAHMGHLWIVDVATGAAHKVAAHTQAYIDEGPAWFPDGRRLAFQSDRTGRMEIWVMNSDGSGQRQITGGVAGASTSPARASMFLRADEVRR